MNSYLRPYRNSEVVISAESPPTHPPIIPIPILSITNNGKNNTEAIIFGSIRKEAEFNPTAGKTVYKWIDMRGEKAGRLVEKAGTDAVLTLSGRVGYVRTTKKAKLGFVKLDIGGATGEASYAFYGEFFLKVADKKGILGSHKMKITTGIVKKSDKGYPPVFNSEDYNTLNKVLRDAIGKFLTERKLMG